MKTKFIIFAILSSLFFSCNKDELTIPEENINLRAKVDGREWKGRANAAFQQVLGRVIIGVGGAWTDGSTITLTFEATDTDGVPTGSYDLTDLAIYSSTAGTTFLARSGTITITKVDGAFISGVFNFYAEDKVKQDGFVTVTEGIFTDVQMK
jgi:hypothetical protein